MASTDGFLILHEAKIPIVWRYELDIHVLLLSV